MLKNIHTNSAIPQFALYGEAPLVQEPGFVHIESIADRSSKNGWFIKPHRHSHLFQILCMFEGELELMLDDTNSFHSGAWAITVPTGVVHGFKFHPDTKGVVLSLAANFHSLNHSNNSDNVFENVLSQTHIFEFQHDSVFHQQIKHYLNSIKLELEFPQADQHTALLALIKIVLVTLRRQAHVQQDNYPAHQTEKHLAGKFKDLLEKHYKQHWKVSDFAQAMHISVSTLNRLCHEAYGTNAKTLVQDRLLIEAKRRLIYTRLNLEQIAYTLGFKDPAYFSRVFKNLEGVSPKAYRNALK